MEAYLYRRGLRSFMWEVVCFEILVVVCDPFVTVIVNTAYRCVMSRVSTCWVMEYTANKVVRLTLIVTIKAVVWVKVDNGECNFCVLSYPCVS